MQIIKYPGRNEWAQLVERPHLDISQLNGVVSSVLDDIRQRGDEAVKHYEQKFDKVELSSLAVTEAEMTEAEALVSDELKAAIA
ncbi:MAG: histidinol dehydrogenase, partial [Prevotella sp.]|nr:histidinol dehydrogenase [Prevotella sp.]